MRHSPTPEQAICSAMSLFSSSHSNYNSIKTLLNFPCTYLPIITHRFPLTQKPLNFLSLNNPINYYSSISLLLFHSINHSIRHPNSLNHPLSFLLSQKPIHFHSLNLHLIILRNQFPTSSTTHSIGYALISK